MIQQGIILSKHTSFKVGGAAKYFAKPQNLEALKTCLSFAKKEKIPYFILGKGSNLIVKDGGLQALCIQTTGLSEIVVDGEYIIAQCGASLMKIANVALQAGLSGFEEIGGIPGTLGGAIAMNAGAYGKEVCDVLIYSEFMSADGQIIRLEHQDHAFAYRHSYYLAHPEYIIISAKIKLNSMPKEQIRQRMDELRCMRMEKQPLEYPSGGSTFKRPNGYFAGQLIEQCGLKGYTVGGAKVSEKHAGFIVNFNHATASDILAVIDHVKNEVFRAYGVALECEVKIIGE